jgi:hypothetical protein
VRKWHRHLATATDYSGCLFTPSGLQTMDLHRSRRDRLGRRIVEVWHVREILDGKALADEGRAMGHCVYSYARMQVVQARGRFNAKADPRDLLVLEPWADRNELTIALGRW